MKRIVYSFFVFFLISSFSIAAPNVSYIIPDIGTPGLATYMEIITNTDGYGNYGIDRKIDNPLSDPTLRIEFQDPNDAKKITFGPLVVSWHGRMIATQVFVNPNLPEPNSTDWDLLNNSNKVIFRLNANGSTSSWITFYIVKPYDFGDLSSNSSQIIFGQGYLGKRSPRGCMIVENLRLNNITYSVSTADCDPALDGNQGYLPFVLLSKNDIIGKNEGGVRTQISVNANGKNAGPGGGGGGGKYCDAHLTGYNGKDGEDGGDGFVGGGPGGGNNSGLPYPNLYKLWGNGTGANNGSINGIPRPYRIDAYENAGGATGHPFGFNGKSSYVTTPTSGNNDGGYGGGSGSTQATASGGGGYSTVGVQTNPYNFGRIHGNKYIVPIAGGSGGASGNPQGMDNCSGNGGGGGGAIRIFANRIENIIISANGGHGGDGDGNTDGGGGSGGYVGVFSKIITDGVTLEANGGNTGGGTNPPVNGAGRVRLDAIYESLTTSIYPDPTVIPQASYKGFASDTTNLVQKLCTITGKKQNNDILDLYLKGESETVWRLIKTENATSQNWSVDLDLRSGTDSVYYFFAIKHVDQVGKLDSVQYTPNFDYSQAAFNILRIDKFPEIAGDTVLNINEELCPGNIPTGVFKIYNNGDANLEIDLENAYFLSGQTNFSFSPNSKITINPNDSAEITVSYLNPIVGTISDTLRFRHNDQYAYRSPYWYVVVNANITEHKIAINDLNGNDIDTLDFGIICIDNVKYLKASVKNLSNSSVNLDSLSNMKYGSGYGYEIKNVVLPNLNDTTQITFSYMGDQEGKFYEKVYIYSDGCAVPKDSIILSIETVIPKITFEKPINFGYICQSATKQRTLLITNPTALSYDLSEIDYHGFSGIAVTFDDGNSILDPFSSKTITISVSPAFYQPGVTSARISFNNAACRSLDIIEFDFHVIVTELSAIETELDFGLVQVGLSKELSGTIKNINLGNAHIEKLPIANAPFEVISSNPILMAELLLNEELNYTVSFTPTTTGAFRDSIEFEAVAFGTNACPAKVKVILIGNASEPEVIVSRNAVDYGLVADCIKPTDTVFIKNVGNFDVKINKADITGVDRNHFSIVSPNGNTPITLKPGESQIYTIRFNSDLLPMGIHNAELIFTGDIPLPKVKLSGTNEQIDLSINPATPLNLGAVPINETRNVAITFINNAQLPVRIININSTDANVILSTNNLTINSGESAILSADIKVINPGNNQYDITYLIDSPCQSNGTYTINAIGLEGKVDYTANLDFGILAPCETKDSIVSITNTGDADIIINNFAVIGVDNNLFTVTTANTIPIIITPNQTITFDVKFDPTASSYGIKNAQIVFNAVINGNSVDLIAQLRGEKQSGLLLTPSTLDFANVVINTAKQKILKLENKGNFILNISSIKIENPNNIFKIHTSIINNILLPGDAIDVNLSFTPDAIQPFNNKLIVYFMVNDCPDSLIIDLNGVGVPATVVNLKLPQLLNQNPKANKLEIPIYANIISTNPAQVLNGISLDFDIEFNGTLLTATEVTNGTLLNTIDPITQKRTFRIRINNANLTTSEGVIGIIQGIPLLGNAQSTNLDILNPSSNNTIDVSSITVTPGMLSYEICQEGNDRLINYKEPLTMKVKPNPSIDYINIEIIPLEKGNHNLEVVNSLGQILKTINFVASGTTNEKFNFIIDVNEYNSGLYMLLLISPNQVSSNQLRIIK